MDAFKLFTDKHTVFECKLELDGASLKETVARLVVKAPDRTLLFTGTVTNEGVCSIPVPKLRGILDENIQGELKLEVIAEDTYFQPWATEFVVQPSKKLTVEVAGTEPVVSSKPTLRVEVSRGRTPSAPTPTSRPKAAVKPSPARKLVSEIVGGLVEDGITASNALKKRVEIKRAIEEHLILSGLEMDAASLVPEIVKSLPKR